MRTISAKRIDGSDFELDRAAVDAFRDRLRGKALLPEDPDYEESRIVWNGSIDRRPALLVQCSGVADVIDAVNFARDYGLLVAIRGGGHNVAGNAVCDGGIVIDLSSMNSVHVDRANKSARVAGGATLGDVDRETQAFGLAAPLGNVSLTGVAGLTLCGGLGWLRQKYGMACDALISADVVTADGRFLKADEDENADLFWAIRGGGGNFGVVTSFEFRLYPVGPMVTLCAPHYRLGDDTAEIMRRSVEFMTTAPDDVSSQFLFWSIPSIPQFPEELHGTPVAIPAMVHCGPLDEGEALFRPLRQLGDPILDLSGPIPFTGLQSAFDPLFTKGERRNYWKSIYLNDIDDEVIDRLVARASNRPSPWALIAIWHIGGAVNRIDPSATALGVRNVPYICSFDTSWTDESDDAAAIAWTREAWSELMDYSNGGAYLNFPGQGEEGEALLRASYGNANYKRLVEIKTKYDPTNMFRLNQNIKPAGV